MSAAEKNRQALLALFGNDALVSRLAGTRIAIALPKAGTSTSASLLSKVLADALGRLWPNIDFVGEGAEAALQVCQDAATSGDAPTDGMRVAWAPPYSLVVSIGGPAPENAAPALQVGANDWYVQFGEGSVCGESSNPVGPAFAAGLVAAQVFATCFAAELEDVARSLAGWKCDVRELFGAMGLEVCDINLRETHVFGVGAVTHGMAWLIENWPRSVSGELHLVDRDAYGIGNGQRYAFMRPGSRGSSKIEAVAARLRRHPQLNVETHATDMNSYCAKRGYDKPLHRIIAGLDSTEARRHAGLKSPDRAINMWTDGMRIGAGQYVPGLGRGCLMCGYPEPADSLMDEVSRFSRQTGLLPDVVRELLDSARNLDLAEAQKVSLHAGVPVEKIVEEPLRSVIPVLCATGSIPLQASKTDVDVPFAFSSLLAGIAGFLMLLRDVQLPAAASDEWTQHVFKRPASTMIRAQGRHHNCVRCSAASLLPEAFL